MARPKHKNPLKYVNWKIVRFLEKQSYNLDSTKHFNPKEYCTKIDERLTQLKRFRRCVCLANYHFVFVTKGRCRVLFPGCRTLVKIKIEQICRDFNFDVLALEVMPEHIHLFVSLNQKISPCKFWHLIRYNLQIFLYETCPILQKALSRDILQRSYYFIFSLKEKMRRTKQSEVILWNNWECNRFWNFKICFKTMGRI